LLQPFEAKEKTVVAEKRQRLTEFRDFIDKISEKKTYKNRNWKCF
jgi:hypothetical protein